MDKESLDIFYEESQELLESLEKSILELEEHPDDMESVNRAFRSLHTLKGSASMLGFEDLTLYAHQAENLFSALRDRSVKVNETIIQWSLQSRDILEQLVRNEGATPEIRGQMDLLLAQCEAFQQGDSHDSGITTIDQTESLPSRTFRVQFTLDEATRKQGLNPLNILRELHEMGSTLVNGDTKDVPSLDELKTDRLYMHWEVILHGETCQEDIEDIFIFAPNQDIFKVEEIGGPGQELPYRRLGEILIDKGLIKEEDLSQAMSPNEFLGDALINLGLIKESQLQNALKEQRFVQKLANQQKVQNQVKTIKVKTQRLDSLMQLIGEFVTLHLNLAHVAKQKEDRDFLGISERMDSLLRELRQLSMELLMIPIGSLFSKYKRPVRDIAKDCGKEVKLITTGEETEFDRNLHEGLSDPMLHLIRNAIDHGIEPPDLREQLGKPREGTLTLEAEYKGTSVVIKISDDGRGMDPEVIRKKALEKGLIDGSEQMSTEEMLELIFEPGFSTAQEVSNVSGRGVGMDVVKKNIQKLRGQVTLQSTPGQGTQVQLRLPLTLASTDSLLVLANGIQYLLPLNYVQECLTMKIKTQITGTLNVREDLISYVDMRRLFANPGDEPSAEEEELSLVIIEDEGQRLALVADSIQDIHQSVIKPLNRLLKSRSFLAGTDILGDGSPAFVLEMHNLMQMAT